MLVGSTGACLIRKYKRVTTEKMALKYFCRPRQQWRLNSQQKCSFYGPIIARCTVWPSILLLVDSGFLKTSLTVLMCPSTRRMLTRMHLAMQDSSPHLAIHSSPCNPLACLPGGPPMLYWGHCLWCLVHAWIPELLKWHFPLYFHIPPEFLFNTKNIFYHMKFFDQIYFWNYSSQYQSPATLTSFHHYTHNIENTTSSLC